LFKVTATIPELIEILRLNGSPVMGVMSGRM
jgi:hypothetical protein